MIEIRNEKLITLDAAALMLPPAGRHGRRLNHSTVFRWITDGVKGPDGRVRLDAVRMGNRWLTSVEALERFAAAQTPDMAKAVAHAV